MASSARRATPRVERSENSIVDRRVGLGWRTVGGWSLGFSCACMDGVVDRVGRLSGVRGGVNRLIDRSNEKGCAHPSRWMRCCFGGKLRISTGRRAPLADVSINNRRPTGEQQPVSRSMDRMSQPRVRCLEYFDLSMRRFEGTQVSDQGHDQPGRAHGAASNIRGVSGQPA